MRLQPFFTYYGGKHRAARHYPTPEHDVLIEPFAGAAGYALNHHRRQVILRDVDPVIVGTWRYLIEADPKEIRSLPDLQCGESVEDLDVPQGARWLIGWWLNKGAAQPCKTPSAWMRAGSHASSFWGPQVRERIARQVPAIRHWRVEQGPYWESPEVPATWFIDPPYQVAGVHYRYGSSGIDFAHLAGWCRGRSGQVLVCEAKGADWLPFRSLARIKATAGRHKEGQTSAEVFWSPDPYALPPALFDLEEPA